MTAPTGGTLALVFALITLVPGAAIVAAIALRRLRHAQASKTTAEAGKVGDDRELVRAQTVREIIDSATAAVESASSVTDQWRALASDLGERVDGLERATRECEERADRQAETLERISGNQGRILRLLQSSMAHLRRLEQVLREAGLPVPPRPIELTDEAAVRE